MAHIRQSRHVANAALLLAAFLLLCLHTPPKIVHGTNKTGTEQIRKSWHIQDSHGTCKAVKAHVRQSCHMSDSHGAYKTVMAHERQSRHK